MTALTTSAVADAFVAAAARCGLKDPLAYVSELSDDIFLVTMSVRNPVAEGDRFLVASSPFQFDSHRHLAAVAQAKAKAFVRSIPTIH